MNHKTSQPDDRVEGLLRQWGAEEAARLAEPAPAFTPRPSTPLATFWRWVPLAAAGLLLAASAALFLAAQSGDDADLRGLRGQLDETARELGQARAALVEAERLSRRQNDKFQKDLVRMRGTFEAQKITLQRHVERQLASFNNALSEKQTLLQEAARQLEDREKQVAAMKADLDKAMALLTDSNGKLAALSRTLDDARRKAATEEHDRKTYQALYEQEATTLARLRQAYVAATVAKDDGLPRIQTAAARNRLIERCDALRRAAATETARELFDSLEVLLTRLEMLDAKDPAECESFAALLHTMDLTRRFGDVFLDDNEDPRVRTWLMETQLVLMGVERAH